MRVIVKPADPDAFKSLSRGLSDRWLELERPDDGGCIVKYQTISQTKEDALHHILTRDITWTLYLDHMTDGVAIERKAGPRAQQLVLKPILKLDDSQPDDAVATLLEPRAPITVLPGAWAILSADGESIMDFCILPRKYKLLLASVDDILAPIATKRGALGSQSRTDHAAKYLKSSSGEARKTGVAGAGAGPSDGPTSGPLVAAETAVERGPVEGKVIRSLDDYHNGAKMTVVGTNGAPEYSLFRMKLYKSSKSTEVFLARHSAFTDRPVVVKVIRRRWQVPDAEADPAKAAANEAEATANAVRDDATYWQNEYQIHQRVQSVSPPPPPNSTTYQSPR